MINAAVVGYGYAGNPLNFSNDVLYQIEIGNLAAAEKPRWYVLGDRGGLIKYGLDPQEGPIRDGNIDAAAEDPAERAQVYKDVLHRECTGGLPLVNPD